MSNTTNTTNTNSGVINNNDYREFDNKALRKFNSGDFANLTEYEKQLFMKIVWEKLSSITTMPQPEEEEEQGQANKADQECNDLVELVQTAQASGFEFYGWYRGKSYKEGIAFTGHRNSHVTELMRAWHETKTGRKVIDDHSRLICIQEDSLGLDKIYLFSGFSKEVAERVAEAF